MLSWLRSLFRRSASPARTAAPATPADAASTPGTGAATQASSTPETAAASPAGASQAAGVPEPASVPEPAGVSGTASASDTASAPEAAAALPRGVDVASYQGPPSSWTSAAGNISWAAVKLTELGADGSRYVNPDAGADWAWLRQHGKGRIGYLYGHPAAGPAETVSFFVNEIRKVGLTDQDAVALDLETSDGRSPAAVAAWALQVQDGLFHALGRSPLLYTFLSFAESGNCAGLGHFPLWIADPSSAAGHPRVPAPWSRWTIHQYDITGSIDRDVADFANESAMFEALGKPEGPSMRNIGGSIVGAVTSVRWPDGVTVVAGLGVDGFIQAARWQNGKWTNWSNISPVKAKGAPALVAFGSSDARMYYTEESGNVIELATSNSGQTWT